LLATVQIVVPTELNEKQKALLRELARTMGKVPVEPKSVLGKVKEAFK
jgi:DnaJ-class molecular chaperone